MFARPIWFKNICIYVDNILLTGSNSTMFHCLIHLLSSEFKLRDLNAVHYFLGIEVQSTGMNLMLWQHKYILDILTRVGMTSCKLVDTLISTSKVTILPDPLFSDPTRFCKSWVLFNISPLRDEISVLLFTESISLCILL